VLNYARGRFVIASAYHAHGSTFRQVAALIVHENKLSSSALDSIVGLLYSNAQNQSASFPEVVQLELRWHAALIQVTGPASVCFDGVGLLSQAGLQLVTTLNVFVRLDKKDSSKDDIESAAVSLEAISGHIQQKIVLPTATPAVVSQWMNGIVFLRAYGSRTMIQAMSEFNALSLSLNLYGSCVKSIGRRIATSSCCALIACVPKPDKAGSMIPRLMEAIKEDEDEPFQSIASDALVSLLSRDAVLTKEVSAKVLKNLVIFSAVFNSVTPDKESILSSTDPIFKNSESSVSVLDNLLPFSFDAPKSDDDTKDIRSITRSYVTARGASTTLRRVAAADWKILNTEEVLANTVFKPLKAVMDLEDRPLDVEANLVAYQDAVRALNAFFLLFNDANPEFQKQLNNKTTRLYIGCLVLNRHWAIRACSARCLAVMAQKVKGPIISFIVKEVLPKVSHASTVVRAGILLCVSATSTLLDMDILPYLALFLMPTVSLLSDCNYAVRQGAAKTFAHLLQLVPLEAGVTAPTDCDAELMALRASSRVFMEQLLDPTKISDAPVDVVCKAKLRGYQQEGVCWLGFLRQYGLNGVLADDMGLGKTIQTLIIVVDTILKRRKDAAGSQSPLPSLILCPPTLVAHWANEISVYFDAALGLQVMQYSGNLAHRAQLRDATDFTDHIIVSSYETVRSDISWFQEQQFLYLALDEGHVIKGQGKTANAIRCLVARHRLILSGTPIQNNVKELWNLFDFLMPGFLGTSADFSRRYNKPIESMQGAASDSQEFIDGERALKALHRCVLPFMLRRLKRDVLKDLPDKIIMDRMCGMSPLQRFLYSKHEKALSNISSDAADPGEVQHVFKSIMYTRKLCTHPRLVQDDKSSDWREAMANYGRASLDELKVSDKMLALKQLLEELDVGGGGESRHRCLIFAQLKQTLDIIQNDVLGRNLPNLSFKRLDGDVPPNDRFALQKMFNSDTSIDLLLLQTSVGGLGLNLTGADTVIFVEHDWNPSKDLQVNPQQCLCFLNSFPLVDVPYAFLTSSRLWTERIASARPRPFMFSVLLSKIA
jgi:TATA-binding protein-associated factor